MFYKLITNILRLTQLNIISKYMLYRFTNRYLKRFNISADSTNLKDKTIFFRVKKGFL